MRQLHHILSIDLSLLPITLMCVLIYVMQGFAADALGDRAETQDYAEDYNIFADQLIIEGDYYRAITEYKRIIFHNFENHNLSGYAAYRIGLCYFNADRWDNAQIWFSNVAKNSALHQQLRKYAQLQIARCYQHKGNFIWAGFELDDLYRRHEKKDILRQGILFWRSWNYLEQREWDIAHSSFQRLCEEFPASEIRSTASEMCKAAVAGKYLPKRSPKLAVRLSSILPGAGLIYSGQYMKGISAAIINVSLTYLISRAIKKRDYLNAAALIVLELRFYNGNRYAAYMGAKEYNERTVKQFLETLRQRSINPLYNCFSAYRHP